MMHRPSRNDRAGVGYLILKVAAFVLLMADATARIRGEDGTISLLVAVPLTKGNQTILDPGWFQMAAALLAVDHFNTRNASIVSELDYDHYRRDCPIQFANVTVVDTGVQSHQAVEFVVDTLQQQPTVSSATSSWQTRIFDAIAGPYHEIPALELSVLATGLQSPIVAHRAFDSNLLVPERHPYFSQVSADFTSEAQFMGRYLRHIGRDNYVAILYSSTSSSEIQKADLLRTVLEQQEGFEQVRAFSYKIYNTTTTTSKTTPTGKGRSRDSKMMNDDRDQSVQRALEKIQQTGFRTIIALPESTAKDAPEIGAAAAALGMDQGDHMWMVSGGIAEMTSMEVVDFLTRMDENNLRFLKGAAYPVAAEQFAPLYFPYWDLNNNKDNDSDSDNNRTFFDRLLAANPVPNFFSRELLEQLSRQERPVEYLQNLSGSWLHGIAHIYDAVIAIGLGACNAVATSRLNGTAMTGKMHLNGIRSVDFFGLSGQIKFGNNDGNPGGRVRSTVPFAALNILPNGTEGPPYIYAESFDPEIGNWTELEQFVYADGTTNPPALLRDEPEMNYLSPTVRAVGLALMAIALLFVFLSTLWVYVNRNHNVVVAAQPALLYALCFGSAMMALTILMASFDESYGWDLDMLSKACVGGVWLDSLGHMIVYCSLATKLWRVHRCMRYKTNNIAVWQVVWPSVLMMGTTISILAAWTATAEYSWERMITDDVTGESIGRCYVVETSIAYLAATYLLHFVPTLFAGVMAWKTSGVDDLYSESKWVLAFILVQVQVLVVAVPLVAILQDLSSDGRFIGYSLLMWTFPMSTMGLIMLPKILTVRRMEKNASSTMGSSATTTPSNGRNSRSSTARDEDSDDTQEAAGNSPARTSNDGMPEDLLRLKHAPRIQIVTFD